MKQIPYGSSAVPLRFEYPTEWPEEDITGLTLTIYNRAGTELMAADAATLWTATTLDGATSRWDDEVTLAAGADNLAPHDTIKIKGIEGDEPKRVRGWNSTGKVAKLESPLDNEYADGDTVIGLFADYSLDISNTTTYPKGLIVRFVWTPAGGGQPVSELVQIAAVAMDIAGLRGDFRDVYTRAYKAFTDPEDRFDRMQAIAERQMTADAISQDWDIQRAVDQPNYADALMAKMALIWTLSGDKDIEDERETYEGEYGNQMAVLKRRVEWLDANQDGIETSDEKQRHVTIFDGPRRW